MSLRVVDHMSPVPNEVRTVEDRSGVIWTREGYTDAWRSERLHKILWNYQLDEFGPFQFEEARS
jgi:hypothetical protein